MAIKRSLLLASLLILPLAGCMSSVGGSIDKRSITGKSGFFSYAILQPTSHGATITLGGKIMKVTTTQITWSGGGQLKLPPVWSQLELAESFDSIIVRIDGNKLATIQPAVQTGANVISPAS